MNPLGERPSRRARSSVPVKFASASSTQKTSDTTQTSSSKTPGNDTEQSQATTDHNQPARIGDSSDEDDVPLAVAKRAGKRKKAPSAKRAGKRMKASSALPALVEDDDNFDVNDEDDSDETPLADMM